MPKPSSLPRWASTTPANIVEPASGKKDTGWIPSEKPPSQYFNWLLNLIYLWCVYVDGLTGEALTWTAAHVFSAGVTFNGTVALNGATTVDDTFHVTGNTTLDLALDVGGILDVIGNINGQSGLNITGGGTFGDVVFGDEFRHSVAQTRIICPSEGFTQSGTDWVVNQVGGVQATVAAPGFAQKPIVVESGEIITVTLRVEHDSASAGAISASLYRTSDSAARTLVGSTQTSLGVTSAHTLTLVTDHTVVAANRYWIEFEGPSGGAMTRYIHHVGVAARKA